MKANWFNNYVCKNVQQLIDRLDQAILDVINNPKRNQKTTSIGTLFWKPLYINEKDKQLISESIKDGIQGFQEEFHEHMNFILLERIQTEIKLCFFESGTWEKWTIRW